MRRKTHNEELGRLSADAFKKAPKQPVIVILDNIRSLHNVGSAFRTADAFRIEKIVLCGCTGRPPDREIEKTALGATQSVTWEYESETVDAVRKAKAEGYAVYSVEQTDDSISLDKFSIDAKLALVFGNEVYGVSQDVIDVSDGIIEIPQIGTKHSLNVSVAIGVVLWEVFRNRQIR